MDSLPLQPPEATPVGGARFPFADGGGGRTVRFSSLGPFGFHDTGGRRRHAAAGREVRRERRPLAEPFRSGAGIIPEPDRGVLRARVPGAAGNAGDAAPRGLPDELTRTRTSFPGPGLRMACERPGEGAGNGPAGP